jgi:hypothetical protein
MISLSLLNWPQEYIGIPWCQKWGFTPVRTCNGSRPGKLNSTTSGKRISWGTLLQIKEEFRISLSHRSLNTLPVISWLQPLSNTRLKHGKSWKNSLNWFLPNILRHSKKIFWLWRKIWKKSTWATIREICCKLELKRSKFLGPLSIRM